MDQKVEANVWKLKDILISRQSALKAVAMSYEGQSKDAQFMLETADKLFDWLIQDQEWTNEKKTVETVSLPVPTPEQSVLLEKFQNKYKVTQEQVLKVYGRYPNNETEALDCLKKIKGN